MKTLADFCIAVSGRYSKRSGKVSFLFLRVCVALLFFYAAFWLYHFPQDRLEIGAGASASAAVEFAGESSARAVSGIRNTMNLLARLPVLRQRRRAGMLIAPAAGRIDDFHLFLDSCELVIGQICLDVMQTHDYLVYLGEYPKVALNSVFTIFASNRGDSDDSVDAIFSPAVASGEHLARMRQQTGLARGAIDSAKNVLSGAVKTFVPVLLFLEEAFALNHEQAADSAAVENLFAAALGDDLFRGFMLKSMSGDVVAVAGDDSVFSLARDSRDCRAIAAFSPFFCGPVDYDKKSRRPVWWVAVPVRDSNRNPAGCLAALVDLSFLQRLSVRLFEQYGCRFVMTDARGVAIAHYQPQNVVESVNLDGSATLLKSEVSEKTVFARVRENKLTFIQAARRLKNQDMRFLPDWKIFVAVPAAQISGSDKLLLAGLVILLAALGVFALSYGFVQLLKYDNKEK
jgi:hypothetical protein